MCRKNTPLICRKNTPISHHGGRDIPSDVEHTLKEAGSKLKQKLMPTSSSRTNRLKFAHRCQENRLEIVPNQPPYSGLYFYKCKNIWRFSMLKTTNLIVLYCPSIRSVPQSFSPRVIFWHGIKWQFCPIFMRSLHSKINVSHHKKERRDKWRMRTERDLLLNGMYSNIQH